MDDLEPAQKSSIGCKFKQDTYYCNYQEQVAKMEVRVNPGDLAEEVNPENEPVVNPPQKKQ